MSGARHSAITLAFPSGTGLTTRRTLAVVTANNQRPRGCSATQQHRAPRPAFLQQRNRRRRRTTHGPTRRRHEPIDADPTTLSVQTTSDPSPVTSAVRIGGRTPPPTVTGINPSSGPTAGGTIVTITGTQSHGRHRGRVRVQRGDERHCGQLLADHRDVSPGSGTVDVTVTTPGGTSATSAADQFTYNAPNRPRRHPRRRRRRRRSCPAGRRRPRPSAAPPSRARSTPRAWPRRRSSSTASTPATAAPAPPPRSTTSRPRCSRWAPTPPATPCRPR